MDERPDEELVLEARRGRKEAFAELVRRHQRKIYGLAYRMAGNHADADDLAQEVFLTAYRSLDGFKGRSGFYTWLYRIAVNLSLNYLKKKGREAHETLEGEAGGENAAFASPERSSAASELGAAVGEAVRSLPPAYKSAFLLVASEGLSHAEAARLLGCSENTVSWRMYRARKMLQARLQPYIKGDAI
jgi:RNA polymerase sigma-70 factor (ECF subfamily)